MSSIALLVGTGPFGEDCLVKAPWLLHLNKKHEVHVVSRIKSEVHYNQLLEMIIGSKEFHDVTTAFNQIVQTSSSLEVVHDSRYITKRYSRGEISDLEEYVGVSFEYLSSLDYRYPNTSAQQETTRSRVLLFAALVDLLRDFYSNHEIDFFINTVEDDIISVAAYFVARRMNIPVIGFVGGRFPKKGMMWALDFSNPLLWNSLEPKRESILSMYDNQTIAGGDVLQMNLRLWDVGSIPRKSKGVRQLTRYDDYCEHIRGRLPVEPLIFKDFGGGNLSYALRTYLKRFLRKRLAEPLIDTPSEEEDYFLFPLHYTEDAQITFREPLLDQFELVKAVSKVLPTGSKLYLKPHPHYSCTDQSIRALTRASRIPNVRIINPGIPPMNLVKGSRGIITINSTTGFEALIFGTPVVTFGHDFYCRDDLCFVVRDMNDLPSIMSKAAKHELQHSPERIVDFMKSIFANTIWIEGTKYEYGFLGLTEDDGRAIASALNKILESPEKVELEYVHMQNQGVGES